ncbi:cysteine-rich receptor-like protein kinase 42 [Olea europaea var. sylvestris]|uniref:cysteine-rich receptor-like protein kinase 42 n=1 Tax=Olea europaea var. sylvestris TaxID=158386 RepID=UPI000C1CE749|nr:cysteine-rich receptor-like protein kinase 42 [Olea europaea var. sylvestris]
MVAIKRLFVNTRQWTNEIFNEVNSISGIQHKNLVKFYGCTCSIEGLNSLLVYEIVPNKNLDQILIDRKIAQLVNWHKRLNIICGIVEGLAHLHEGCQAKIIHRYIKSRIVSLRPSMSKVVRMLRDDNKSVILKAKQPPFQNSCLLNSDDTTNSSGSNIIDGDNEAKNKNIIAGNAFSSDFNSYHATVKK